MLINEPQPDHNLPSNVSTFNNGASTPDYALLTGTIVMLGL